MTEKIYEINSRIIKFKPHKFKGKLTLEEYENQIYNSLLKIGISKPFISIELSNDIQNPYAIVSWIINKKSYMFKCSTQENNCLNLGAISQAIQEDIRQVTRGIKDLFKVMTQYDIIKIKKNQKKSILDFNNNFNNNVISNNNNNNNNNNLIETFPVDENKIDYINPNEKLKEKYFYLMNYSKEQLDRIYYKLKEQCILQNKPNHEMFIALKIVRVKKGLDL